jgi:hypothetical protein
MPVSVWRDGCARERCRTGTLNGFPKQSAHCTATTIAPPLLLASLRQEVGLIPAQSPNPISRGQLGSEYPWCLGRPA